MLLLLSVLGAPARARADEDGLSGDKALSEGLTALGSYLGDLNAMRRMSPEQRKAFVLDQAESRIYAATSKWVAQRAQKEIEEYARAKIARESFWAVAAPRLKGSIALGQGVPTALWSELQATRLPDMEERVAAVSKALTLSVDVLHTWYHEGGDKAQQKLFQTAVDETAGKLLPGYEVFKAALGVVEALRDYVLGYAWETARAGIVKCMFEPQADPSGFASWLEKATPKLLHDEVRARWDVGSQCKVVSPLYLGKATALGERSMQDDVVFTLLSMRGDLVLRQKGARQAYAEAVRRQAALDKTFAQKRARYLAAANEAADDVRRGLAALARAKASLGTPGAAPAAGARAKPQAAKTEPAKGVEAQPVVPPSAPRRAPIDASAAVARLSEVLAFWSSDAWRNATTWAWAAEQRASAGREVWPAIDAVLAAADRCKCIPDDDRTYYDSAVAARDRISALDRSVMRAEGGVRQTLQRGVESVSRASHALPARYVPLLAQQRDALARVHAKHRLTPARLDTLANSLELLQEGFYPIGGYEKQRAAWLQTLKQLQRAQKDSRAAFAKWEKVLDEYDGEVARLRAQIDRVVPPTFWQSEQTFAEDEFQDGLPAGALVLSGAGFQASVREPIDRERAGLALEGNAKLHPKYIENAIATLQEQLAWIDGRAEIDIRMQGFAPATKKLAAEIEALYRSLPQDALMDVAPLLWVTKLDRSGETVDVDRSLGAALSATVSAKWPPLRAKLSRLRNQTPPAISGPDNIYSSDLTRDTEARWETIEHHAAYLENLSAALAAAKQAVPAYFAPGRAYVGQRLGTLDADVRELESPKRDTDVQTNATAIAQELAQMKQELERGSFLHAPHRAAITRLIARVGAVQARLAAAEAQRQAVAAAAAETPAVAPPAAAEPIPPRKLPPALRSEAVAAIVEPVLSSIDAMKAQVRRDPGMAASYRSHAHARAQEALDALKTVAPAAVAAAKAELDAALRGL